MTRQPLPQVSLSPRARLLDTVAAVLGVDPGSLDDASSPESVPSWDSLNHLNIVMSIEGEFRLALSPEQVIGMGSIAAICDTLRTYGIEI